MQPAPCTERTHQHQAVDVDPLATGNLALHAPCIDTHGAAEIKRRTGACGNDQSLDSKQRLIEGTIAGRTFRLSQFADDTLLFLRGYSALRQAWRLTAWKKAAPEVVVRAVPKTRANPDRDAPSAGDTSHRCAHTVRNS